MLEEENQETKKTEYKEQVEAEKEPETEPERSKTREEIMQALFGEYEARIKELESQVSELRKEGKDPLIAAAMLRNIHSKIEWAKYNDREEDFEKVEQIFEKVKQEIKDASEKDVLNVKKELQDRAVDDAKMEEAERALRAVSEKAEAGAQPEVQEGAQIIEEEKVEAAEAEKEEAKPWDRSFEEMKQMEEDFIEQEYRRTIEDPEKFFFLSCGHSIVSLQDFIDKLPQIPDDCFQHHTQEYENDFSKWILHVFHNEELAKKIKGVKDKQLMLQIILAEKRGE
jgi:hypothetical protein